ncbi:MAG: Vitamin epoxide reductase [Acidimicrobiaceae bacterium]|nr:Vitamin epoxide reductase [Acidimicrobiaceae bacterium]
MRKALPRWVVTTSLGLSLLAVGLTAYLTVTHYTDPTTLACPDVGIINCTAVTTSSWSVILGVPVALLGLLWAVGMAALNFPWAWRSTARWLDIMRLAMSGAGVIMATYLVYIELFRVDAICLWCTGVHLTAIALFTIILVARTTVPSGWGAVADRRIH